MKLSKRYLCVCSTVILLIMAMMTMWSMMSMTTRAIMMMMAMAATQVFIPRLLTQVARAACPLSTPARLSHPHANIPTACLCLCVCVCVWPLPVCVYDIHWRRYYVFLIVLIFGSVDISNPTCPYQSAAPPLRYSQVHPNDAQICQFAHLTPTRENGQCTMGTFLRIIPLYMI